MSDIKTETRNAGLAEIIGMLKDQRARRLDLVADAPAVSAINGLIQVAQGQATMDRQGVHQAGGVYRPTKVFDEGIASRLGIPGAYLTRLRDERPDLYDANVNGWLHGGGDVLMPGEQGNEHGDGPVSQYPPDSRKHLLRLLKGDEGDAGVARAFLSQRYRIMDNLDLAVAITRGIQAAGINAVPTACDLSDRRMYLRFACPEIWAASPHWLEGYKNPFGPGGRERAGGENTRALDTSHGTLWQAAEDWASTRGLPVGTVVGLGLVASNSDVGGGARFLAPQARVVICRNGQTINRDASRRVHLGSAMEAGVIEWSTETAETEIDLIQAQTTDAVKTWLTQDYLDETVAEVEQMAGHKIRKPETAVKEIVTGARFTQTDADEILSFMLDGGQGSTAGALANAVTAYAQTVESPDKAAELENAAMGMMQAAARR